MRPTVTLINALRKAADRIETSKHWLIFDDDKLTALRPDIYHWDHPCTCNCGILAQELGLSAKQIYDSDIVIWSDHVTVCSATGHQTKDVFAHLSQFGLEGDDFKRIEFCGMDKNSPNARWEKPGFVARYFRAQADILEEQLAEQWESRPLLASAIQPAQLQPEPATL